MIDQLDKEALYETVMQAREAYRAGLPELKDRLEAKYNLENSVMSAFTLGNWLVGFLDQPDQLPELLDKHHRVPTAALEEGLPDLLNMLENMPEGHQEWQRALALLSLPLMAKN